MNHAATCYFASMSTILTRWSLARSHRSTCVAEEVCPIRFAAAAVKCMQKVWDRISSTASAKEALLIVGGSSFYMIHDNSKNIIYCIYS